MRPLRIRAEGFAAYRSPVEVDFDGIEFFSLSGATGSGKSSLIDAVVFALYGRVPRLGGSTIAPAISAGGNRARVAFDFLVDGVEYTAVRLVERTKTGGASVKEARLQKGDIVIANGADEVTVAVGELLKLRFEDFTRTVVLPQGEFAQFLTATKSERQALLRSLLGLEVYTSVRALANTRAAVAADRAATAKTSLGALDVPGEEAVAKARERLGAIEVLATEIVDREKKLSRLDGEVEKAQVEVDRLAGASKRLDSISPPEQLETLEGLADDAREGVATAGDALENAKAEMSSLEGRFSKLITPAQMADHREKHRTLSSLEEITGGHDLGLIEAGLATASDEFDVISEQLRETRAVLADARISHAAHALQSSLVVGQPCPVCDHVVSAQPPTKNLEELRVLEETEATQLQSREDARLKLDGERERHTAARATYLEQNKQLIRLRESMAETPSIEELGDLEEQYAELAAVIRHRGARLIELNEELDDSRKTLEDLADASRRVNKQLTAAQLEVADLNPPVSEADDVVVRWKDLLLWRDQMSDTVQVETVVARETVANATKSSARERQLLTAHLETFGIRDLEPYSAQVAGELERTRQKVREHEKTLDTISELNKEVDEASAEAGVAEVLAGHLKANGFERWLMAGALADLVGGANGLLGELSSGSYSLHSDEVGSFSIIDHRNADEMRSVSTLSGGETFLVSLSLALALAETLAAAGGARLDTIVLDEGFGSLDTESLDIVASVLEELAGDGLMVGVITHVKELADRAPTRFEVTREPTGAKVVLIS